MKTDDLVIFNLQHDHDKMADVFHNAIMYAYPDIENLVVSYDGKNLTIDFSGRPFFKASVLVFVNGLIHRVSNVATPPDEQIDRIFKNSTAIMKSGLTKAI